MYNVIIKFRFCDKVTASERFSCLGELFEELGLQEINGKLLPNGSIESYEVRSNGKVSLLSFYPGSTAIVRKFIKFKQKQGIVEQT